MEAAIDHADCEGAGICQLIAPAVFEVSDEGIAHVRDGDQLVQADMEGLVYVTVPPEYEDAVAEAAEGCPTGCIKIR